MAKRELVRELVEETDFRSELMGASGRMVKDVIAYIEGAPGEKHKIDTAMQLIRLRFKVEQMETLARDRATSFGIRIAALLRDDARREEYIQATMPRLPSPGRKE